MIVFSSDSLYAYTLLNEFIEKYHKEISLIYISKSLRRQKLRKFFKKKVMKGLGFQYYAQRAFHILKHHHSSNSIVKLALKYNIPTEYTSNINSSNVLNIVREEKPDMIIAAYFDQIINKDLLKIPTFGILNIHMSMLPKYRGVKPVFWALNNNESTTGISIHLMDEGLDTGDIIAQKEISISPEDSMDLLSIKISKIGSRLLIDSVENIFLNRYNLQKQNLSSGSYYSQPTRKDVAQFHRQGKRFY